MADGKGARLLLLGIVGVVLVATTMVAVKAWAGRSVPVTALEPCSALAACFSNYGNPTEQLGVFHRSATSRDPVRTFYWKDTDTLRRGVLELLEEARARGLDGSGRQGNRRGAVDLVFASNHSLRTPVPGENGERVGKIIVDRSRPSPGRAGMLALFEELRRTHRGAFEGVRIYNVFLLNCGSYEDLADHRLITESIEAMTGRPPAHILTTSGKVTPAYNHVTAGYATGLPITIYDSLPGPDGPRTVPFLQVASGGHFDFASGSGLGIERPPGIPDRQGDNR